MGKPASIAGSQLMGYVSILPSRIGRSGEVGDDRHTAASLLRRWANALDALRVADRAAVGEVQACDVQPGMNQAFQHPGRIRSWSDRGDSWFCFWGARCGFVFTPPGSQPAFCIWEPANPLQDAKFRGLPVPLALFA